MSKNAQKPHKINPQRYCVVLSLFRACCRVKTMKEQDKRAVEGLARCGISLEGLIEAFPKFKAEDITEVYNEVHKLDMKSCDITIKINCS